MQVCPQCGESQEVSNRVRCEYCDFLLPPDEEALATKADFDNDVAWEELDNE